MIRGIGDALSSMYFQTLNGSRSCVQVRFFLATRHPQFVQRFHTKLGKTGATLVLRCRCTAGITQAASCGRCRLSGIRWPSGTPQSIPPGSTLFLKPSVLDLPSLSAYAQLRSCMAAIPHCLGRLVPICTSVSYDCRLPPFGPTDMPCFVVYSAGLHLQAKHTDGKVFPGARELI